MKKPRRKKYLSGSPINGVIPNPQDVLAENQIMQAKAQYAAETNPWIMGLETVAGIGMGILGNSNFAQNGFQPRQKSLAGQPVNQQAWGNFNNNPWGQNPNQTMYAAYGGMVPQQVPIEAEGGELAQTPDGQMMGFQGPSHEQGGIDANLPEATKIYSNRVSVDGVSMANRKGKREKRRMSLEALLAKNKNDALMENALKRTMQANQVEEQNDLQTQELVGNLLQQQEQMGQMQMPEQMQAMGTGSQGLYPYFAQYAAGTGAYGVEPEPPKKGSKRGAWSRIWQEIFNNKEYHKELAREVITNNHEHFKKVEAWRRWDEAQAEKEESRKLAKRTHPEVWKLWKENGYSDRLPDGSDIRERYEKELDRRIQANGGKETLPDGSSIVDKFLKEKNPVPYFISNPIRHFADFRSYEDYDSYMKGKPFSADYFKKNKENKKYRLNELKRQMALYENSVKSRYSKAKPRTDTTSKIPNYPNAIIKDVPPVGDSLSSYPYARLPLIKNPFDPPIFPPDYKKELNFSENNQSFIPEPNIPGNQTRYFENIPPDLSEEDKQNIANMPLVPEGYDPNLPWEKQPFNLKPKTSASLQEKEMTDFLGVHSPEEQEFRDHLGITENSVNKKSVDPPSVPLRVPADYGRDPSAIYVPNSAPMSADHDAISALFGDRNQAQRQQVNSNSPILPADYKKELSLSGIGKPGQTINQILENKINFPIDRNKAISEYEYPSGQYSKTIPLGLTKEQEEDFQNLANAPLVPDDYDPNLPWDKQPFNQPEKPPVPYRIKNKEYTPSPFFRGVPEKPPIDERMLPLAQSYGQPQKARTVPHLAQGSFPSPQIPSFGNKLAISLPRDSSGRAIPNIAAKGLGGYNPAPVPSFGNKLAPGTFPQQNNPAQNNMAGQRNGGFGQRAQKWGSNMPTVGDMMGVAGNLYQGFAPYFNTLENRAMDTPNINPYENYGKEGLATLENSKSYIDQIQASKLRDLQYSTNAGIREGRNSAQGINTMRALNMAARQGANRQMNEIYNNTSQQMMALTGQQAAMQNDRDKMVMQGNYERDTNNRKDLDNYYKQLGQNKVDIGRGIAQAGNSFNNFKERNNTQKFLNNLADHVGYNAMTGEFFVKENRPTVGDASRVAGTDAELAQEYGYNPAQWDALTPSQKSGYRREYVNKGGKRKKARTAKSKNG